MLEPSPTPRAARRRALIIFLLGMAASVVVVVLLNGALNASETRDAQKVNSPKIDTSAKTLKVVEQLARDINSCVNPKGKCAVRNQKNTGKAINEIALRQVATVACADAEGTQTTREIKACVDRSLHIWATTGAGDAP